ncbi:rhombotarget lipoprotein [Trichlorobacter lovleyi]|uniref:rhombotarget lipoprotein n=1 Tax=Trichlorobacter lovleyi TaxID=313985 RepID=UPI00223F34ED|nr:rhombotarget lipoprotein [Trichlorobacter lovleyi]QOX78243.1 rhombotarget lipoprotein [Trichlorobacter lovleyi]
MKYPAIILVACFVFCSGCASYNSGLRTVQKQSNLASFLFSCNQPQTPAQKAPLQLPARVGVAFVPGDPASSNLPETTKKEVIETVRAQLAKHTKYVAGAQAIPSIYLTPRGGVQNLEQVAQQFGVDVIVILGANQFQKHERNSLAALLDVTIIGQYLIPGNTVDTATVLEAAVYHVPSRALIFRTDGANKKRSRSTRYGSSQTAQNDAADSILDASKKLVVSIGEALVGFEKFDAATAQEIQPLPTSATNTVNEQKNYWDKANRYRSSGGGSFDLIWIALTGAGLLCAARIRRQH